MKTFCPQKLCISYCTWLFTNCFVFSSSYASSMALFTLLFRSIDDTSNELIMWVNAQPKVITVECRGEEFILPPFSSFIINDACVSRALIKCEFVRNFILNKIESFFISILKTLSPFFSTVF